MPFVVLRCEEKQKARRKSEKSSEMRKFDSEMSLQRALKAKNRYESYRSSQRDEKLLLLRDAAVAMSIFILLIKCLYLFGSDANFLPRTFRPSSFGGFTETSGGKPRENLGENFPRHFQFAGDRKPKVAWRSGSINLDL
jgi:hypothetical protein